jgi:TetR/AcrR family transcriptional regulator, fatty acid metabolism regulator protein
MTVSERGVSLRERQRQERERLIVRAAADLFMERGYHDTSMDDIAARVGIAKGTVYLHFASKEDLALALFEHGIRGSLHRLDAILSEGRTPRAKLEAVLAGTYGAMADGSFQFFSTVMRSPEVLARLHEKRETLAELWKEPMARLTEILEAGKAVGEFDPDMPTPIMLSLFLGLLGPHRWELPAAANQSPAEIARHVSRFFFKGIAPNQPSSHAPPAASQP